MQKKQEEIADENEILPEFLQGGYYPLSQLKNHGYAESGKTTEELMRGNTDARLKQLKDSQWKFVVS